MKKSVLIATLVSLSSAGLWADPPTDSRSKAIYDHDREWLSHFPPSFVATNIRGEGLQYKERRQAALDLVRQQRDFGVVSELMQAIREDNFLSPQICDLLGEWKARRALSLLRAVADDSKRSKVLREHARLAAQAISSAPVDHPPVF